MKLENYRPDYELSTGNCKSILHKEVYYYFTELYSWEFILKESSKMLMLLITYFQILQRVDIKTRH